MKSMALALLGGFILTSTVGAESLGVPDAPTIAKLEANVQLPAGAYPLATYQRYYAYAGKPGHLLVDGVYLARNPHGAGTVHLVPSPDLLPEIADGGCSVVQIWWDVTTARMLGAACNGYA